MTTFLFVRGMDIVTIDESFNLARQRINQAVTNTKRDGTKAEGKDAAKPLHLLSFTSVDSDGDLGRIAVVPGHVIGVGSDQLKDGDDEE